MTSRPGSVTIVEVGPRDGLQNEAASVSTADKVAVRRPPHRGRAAGHRSRRVRQPEMGAADGRRRGRVRPASTRRDGTRYTALVPNLAGLERAQSCRRQRDRASSPRRPRRSAGGTSISRSRSRSPAIATSARAPRSWASACAATCRRHSDARSKGAVPVERVADVCDALISMGAFEVAVSDTIGIAHPGQVPQRRGARRGARAAPADRPALSRHARHRSRQRARGARSWNCHVRLLGRRPRRLSLRAWRHRQPGDRGSRVHARWAGHPRRESISPRWSRRSRFMEPRIGHSSAVEELSRDRSAA